MAEQTQEQTDAIDRLFKVGAHFGYSKRKRHPSVKPYLFGAKNRVEIFDLAKTHELLETAKTFMRTLGSGGKHVLFVGGKNEARDAVVEGATAVGMPYVAGRWIGGTLTNFSEVHKRLTHLASLMEQRDKGEFESKYTKREQGLLHHEIADLTEKFGGIRALSALPDALVVVDTKHEDTAVREANRKAIPLIGLLNSDCDADLVTYPIVGNDASRMSITFFVGELVEAYQEGRRQREKTPVAPQREDAS